MIAAKRSSKGPSFYADLALAMPRRSGSVLVRIFWRAASLEVLNGRAVNLNPSMFRLLENRSDGGWVFWVCQRANGNTNQRGEVVGFPIDC
jgi:hypothetical protein